MSTDSERECLVFCEKKVEEEFVWLSETIRENEKSPEENKSEMNIVFRMFYVSQKAANFSISLIRDMLLKLTGKAMDSKGEFCGDFLLYFAFLEDQFYSELKAIRTVHKTIGKKRMATIEKKNAEKLLDSEEIKSKNLAEIANRLTVSCTSKPKKKSHEKQQVYAFVVILKSIMSNLANNFKYLRDMDEVERNEVFTRCDPVVKLAFDCSNDYNIARLSLFLDSTSGNNKLNSIVNYLNKLKSSAKNDLTTACNVRKEKFTAEQLEKSARFLSFLNLIVHKNFLISVFFQDYF